MRKCRYLLLGGLVAMLIFSVAQAGSQTREAAEKELEEIQQKIDKYDLGWEARLTSRLLDYAPEERSYGWVVPDNWEEIKKQRRPVLYPSTWFRDLPSSFNWEDSNKITPVRNQGGCGSCWIFAATAALEGVHWINRNEPLDISEQAVLSCLSPYSGCDGGWPEIVYEHFRDEGVFLETCMPYLADDEIPCATEECDIVSEVNEWFYIADNVEDVKAAVMMGPVAVCFDVYADFNGYANRCYWHYDDGSYPEAGHCVLITGWDDNMCDGEGGWRAKNSWGTYWGDDGYFWIKYENNCNFPSETMLLSVNFVKIESLSPLPEANLCGEYNYQVEASGGTPPYTWSYAGGIYPPGITLEPSGLFHGTPTQAKQCWFTLRVADESQPTALDFGWFGLKINDATCFTCGDCNEDEDINILDIVYLINYIYKSGPPPIPWESGEVDGDGMINILDVVYLINYIYKNGPPPVES